MPEPSPNRQDPVPEFVILTGLSGSGKGTVLRVFEDLGYYAVDNLPVDLLPKFIELCRQSTDTPKAALVVDVRGGDALKRIPEIYAELRSEVNGYLIFLDASDDVLQRRFSETRRPHPLGRGGAVVEQVRAERAMLEPIRDLADLVIDTSAYNIHELRRLIVDRFSGGQSPVLLVTVQSFGFKHGVPTDADLVFDVRFLPNPHYLPGGKELTGQDRKVIEYIESFPQTGEFIERVSDLLVYLLPHYASEGKSYLTIAFGCTGGRHRSVMIAERIHARVECAGFAARLQHRDIYKGSSG